MSNRNRNQEPKPSAEAPEAPEVAETPEVAEVEETPNDGKVDCVVVRGGLHLNATAEECAVGDELRLTEKQIAAFTGKVVVKGSADTPLSFKSLLEANAEIDRLKKVIETLKA